MATKGKVIGIVANLVTVEVDGPVGQNEICEIDLLQATALAETIKIDGNKAFVQLFQSSRGLKIGNKAVFLGHMLEVELGPGMLSKRFDGLQSDLDKFTGVFLKSGEKSRALDEKVNWHFKPRVKKGDTVAAGSWLGEVKEGWIPHKIMAPFGLLAEGTITSIVPEGEYTVDSKIASIKAGNEEIRVNLSQRWPIKLPIKAYTSKPRAYKLLETSVRVMDTLNPLVEGGTGFIPGPFGCGKTVLQHAIASNAEADIVVIAACGERANEVVEIFVEFPELDDPRTGRKLMERTIIVANTSNMPVAAREASVYTAMTIAEYYRQMGLKVLLLADSTSRWAQALREMSNRLEELPGPDAYPMDLPAVIANFYARAGLVNLPDNTTGSVTFIGTVSPAGGNMKEPVTESTKKVARCFYGLAQHRSDAKRYPSIDPLDSYSKYLEYAEVQEYLAQKISPVWVSLVLKAKDILRRGKEAHDQINILGDDSVPLEYHDRFWKSEMIDFIILQQDNFDPVDKSTSMERQKYMLEKIMGIVAQKFTYTGFADVAPFFKKVINILKQMNYSEFKSKKFNQYEEELQLFLTEQAIKEKEPSLA
ncbi:MAG: V-type ATP synthase subunit A [bacterium]